MANVLAVFESMPAGQVWLIVFAAVVAVVAANGVFALHYRRVRKPVLRSLFNPADLPILQFNLREWLLLAVVAAVFFGLIFLAVLAGPEA